MTSVDDSIPARIAKIAKLLRQKRRDITPMFQQAETKLIRCFDTAERETIAALARAHINLKQKNDAVHQAVDAFDVLHIRSVEFTSDEPPDGLESIYANVCRFQQFLAIPDLDRLIADRPPRDPPPPFEFQGIPDNEIGPYCKRFVTNKACSPGRAERLRYMFPPPKIRKPQTATTGSNRRVDDQDAEQYLTGS
jgi:hypothetical protein